ncbi:adenine DNA glycosylase isoform X2 [Electrophorus electricus]|uniref:adenine DNA glycosylase isoform X2 n=1 Tax=Electrophorus electricus TaxID=8005 RepID=UPI0015D09ABC|nr:adenine DNA glycosylase isoform X2 [Electrophorus electricus]
MRKRSPAVRAGKRAAPQNTPAGQAKKKAELRLGGAESARPSSYHFFNEPAEVSLFRSRLLRWYDQSKRDLPWRTVAMTETDANIRTYAVWVSEVMLQQTQVATVIDYYNKWMKRWPTVQELAAASVEDVNEMWAGLGYYSRGRRLHQGAQKVMSELAGEMPRTTQGLLKWLPGVGRYTAGAVGSIALGLVTGAVDGNVTRVLCRLRAIGADCTSSLVTDLLWEICNLIVDPERPGQFNQALMELGALVCRPKSPLCARCPVQTHCHAYRKVILIQETDAKSPLSNPDSVQSPCVPDIEDCSGDSSCKLCLSEGWARDLGVQNYPRKPVRKAPRVERMVTCVLRCRMTEDEDEPQYLLIQRPSTGLLAGMWELPSILLEEDIPGKKHRALLSAEVQRIVGTSPDEDSFQYLGEVVHIFSHIHQTYVVYSASVGGSTERDREPQSRWVSASALQEAAVSTGVKKIMKLYYESTSKLQGTELGPKGFFTVCPFQNKKQKRSAEARRSQRTKRTRNREDRAPCRGLKQSSLSQFFTSSKPAST